MSTDDDPLRAACAEIEHDMGIPPATPPDDPAVAEALLLERARREGCTCDPQLYVETTRTSPGRTGVAHTADCALNDVPWWV